MYITIQTKKNPYPSRMSVAKMAAIWNFRVTGNFLDKDIPTSNLKSPSHKPPLPQHPSEMVWENVDSRVY